MLVLTAAVTVGGIAAAGPAGAATVGTVQVTDVPGSKGTSPYWDTWNATWGKAWDTCRARYGTRIKSLELQDYDYYDRGNTRYYSGVWACRDTP